MSDPRDILILSDSPSFGGHEMVFLTFLPAILSSGNVNSVTFIVPAVNQKLITQLRTFESDKITIVLSPFVKKGGEPYLAWLRHDFKRFIRQQYDALQPDTVLLLQGRIENLCVAMLALPPGADIVSYLPMAHSVESMGKSLGSLKLPDLIRRIYYRRPQRLIVPSQAAKAQAISAGAKGEVFVARNVVPKPNVVSQAEARRKLGLSSSGRIAIYIGRFDTHQKGLDKLVSDIVASPDPDWTFLFVGDGDGKALLHDAKGRLSDPEALQIISWTDDPASYLLASDVLLLPSRYEGVPLIMLEAIGVGLPILASRIDVYEEYLSADSLFDFGQGDNFYRALKACSHRRADLTTASAHSSSDVNLQQEATRFLNGLLSN